MNKLWLLGIAVLMLVSCKTQQNVPSTPPVSTNKKIEKDQVFFNNILRESAFKNLKISSKIKVDNGSPIPTLDALVYIENQKKVWINLSALFFNVARGVATPEGVKGYEKYNKTYIDSDFSYLNRLLNVNFIDYSALQNLLVGRTFVPIKDGDFDLTKNAQGYHLTSAKNQKITVDGKVNEYKMELDYDTMFNLSRVKLSDAKTPDYLEVFYTNWDNFEGNYLPKNVKIIIKAKKTDQIFIENTKFDSSTMDTPYTVPSNYTKKEIK
ncbi:DUF4292 domain-containing protein [Riemerella anatipestifer]|uniref:DUF4292 domain-containing protein n=1 Tax=Riemerella anatipestifer TaxID=34085 RepID=UPI0012AE92AF|nr:DUF4292 domain-containing protein [Riemerella anatipestifer]MDY3362439.1 DUF4292 domain-containing protein [Riemerella anatipestifer]MDY3521208.1 DUF4292 domain-containing protein [Riemerella anatipestifer]MDY3533671.1 DUF4292 domain-containing protein [Riemerella anatipestifer]MDY3535712.1 DUF4292 domain-containing protein [Riemerella anatipestifer]USL95949.1 DUF4292 domain-containing protein [Riemerella anatipestifer]